MMKIQFKITGMHCSSCAMNIEGELEELQGVKQANVHFAKQTTQIEYDETQISSQQLITTIEKLGYQVYQT